jgi:hypothetical protein
MKSTKVVTKSICGNMLRKIHHTTFQKKHLQLKTELQMKICTIYPIMCTKKPHGAVVWKVCVFIQTSMQWSWISDSVLSRLGVEELLQSMKA